MEDISEDLNFDNLFKIMLVSMKINKCHPEVPKDRKWLCQFLMMHGLFCAIFCLIVYSTIFYEFKNGNLTQACANGIISIIFCVVSLKYWVMLWYQDLLKSLMDEMKIDYRIAKTFSRTEQQIVHNYAKRGKKVVQLWLVIALVASSLFVVKSFVLMMYYLIKGKFQLVPLFDLTYPSPVEETKNKPVVYIILYIMFLFYDGYAMIMYIAMSGLGPVFMLHACGQLELVKGRLMNIFDDYDTQKTTLEKFSDIVIHLQNIYSFLARIQTSFNILYELTLRFTSIILPITFYQVTQSYHDGDIRIEFITIVIGAMTLSSVPCYYGEQIMNMGENVRLAVYMCGWENHLSKYKELRSTLLIIQSRATRAAAIHTMFRRICLTALTDVYHQAYAIFNFLNAVPR